MRILYIKGENGARQKFIDSVDVNTCVDTLDEYGETLTAGDGWEGQIIEFDEVDPYFMSFIRHEFVSGRTDRYFFIIKDKKNG